MASILRVVGSNTKKNADQDTEVSAEELLNAETQLREEAKASLAEISAKYWNLGRILYDVFDGVPGGYRAKVVNSGIAKDRTSLFAKWGYKTFGEYCEKEIGLQKRNAENLRYMYWWFAIQQPLPEPVIAQLITLGRSKVYLLSGVANRDNIALWLEKAKDLTFDELKKAIQAAKALAAGKHVDTEERDSSGGSTSSGPREDRASVPEAVGAKSLPPPESWHQVNVPLAEAQFETWEAAFKRAKSLSNSEKVGHNLELICQDFLANNDLSGVKAKDRSAYLAKTERRLGVLIIAVDPNTGKPVHGRDLLWRMMSEKQDIEDTKE